MGCRYRLRQRIRVLTDGYWSWSPKLRPDDSNESLGQLHKIASLSASGGQNSLLGMAKKTQGSLALEMN